MSALLAATIAALTGSAAVAGTVNVSPARLTIARSGTSTDLALTNAGTNPIRFSVRAYRWRQDIDGGVVLTPADDLIVFPQILTIASQDRRTVRIGFTGTLPAAEADYRIVATELPIADDAPAAPGLTIRSKLSLPLFVVPAQAHHEVAIDDGRATAAKVAFALTERARRTTSSRRSASAARMPRTRPSSIARSRDGTCCPRSRGVFKSPWRGRFVDGWPTSSSTRPSRICPIST